MRFNSLLLELVLCRAACGLQIRLVADADTPQYEGRQTIHRSATHCRRTSRLGVIFVFLQIPSRNSSRRCSCSSCCCRRDYRLFNKAQVSVVSNRTWVKFGRIVLQVNAQRLKEPDFWCDVILSRWSPWRHFTQKSAVMCRCTRRSVSRLPASNSACSSYSILVYLPRNGDSAFRAFSRSITRFQLQLHFISCFIERRYGRIYVG